MIAQSDLKLDMHVIDGNTNTRYVSIVASSRVLQLMNTKIVGGLSDFHLSMVIEREEFSRNLLFFLM